MEVAADGLARLWGFDDGQVPRLRPLRHLVVYAGVLDGYPDDRVRRDVRGPVPPGRRPPAPPARPAPPPPPRPPPPPLPACRGAGRGQGWGGPRGAGGVVFYGGHRVP